MSRFSYFNYELLQKLSRKLNFSIHFKNHTDKYGYILFDNNIRHYISQGSLLLNSYSAFSLAKNKRFTNEFLLEKNFSVPSFEHFFKFNLEGKNNNKENKIKIENFLSNNNFPLYIKPVDGSKGDMVYCVSSEAQIRLKMEKIFKKYKGAILQETVIGDEYRFIIYKNTIVAVYKKNPIYIYADGIQTKKKHLEHILEPEELSDLPYLNKIYNKGELIYKSEKLNAKFRRDIADVSSLVHSSIKKYVLDHALILGMTLSGVDMIIAQSINRPLNKEKIWCLEINAHPGLKNYYNFSSDAANRIVNLYTAILEDIELGKVS